VINDAVNSTVISLSGLLFYSQRWVIVPLKFFPLVSGLRTTERPIRGENIFFSADPYKTCRHHKSCIPQGFFSLQNAMLKSAIEIQLHSFEVMLPRKLAKAVKLPTFILEVSISNLRLDSEYPDRGS
jgi:hypothetical protein